MSSGQAIRAVQLFTKEGRSKQVNFLMEVTIGLGLGIAVGFTWKVYHWNETRKINQYYHDLARLNKEAAE